MNPHKLQQRVNELMRESTDNCTLCGRPFPHLGTTYFCETKGDEVEHIGDCCVRRFKEAFGGSIYLNPANATKH